MKRGMLLVAVAAGLASARLALATDYNWTNGGGSGLWGDGTNWSPAGLPGAGDNLVLNSEAIGGPLTIDLGGARRIDRIEGGTLGGVYTFSNSGAGALEIGAPDGIGVLLTQSAPGWLVFNSNLALAAAGEVQFQTQSPSSRIVVNGSITSSAVSGTTTLNLTSLNPTLADVIEVNGVISDGAGARMALTAGDAAHADVNRGQILITGLNTYSGPTTVNGMMVVFNSIGNFGPGAAASALGAPTTLADGTITLGSNTFGIVNQPGRLRYVGTNPAGHSSNRPIRFVGLSPGGTIDASGVGPLVLSGGITSTPSTETNRVLTLTGSNTGNNTFAGAIEDVPDTAVQSLVKTGAGKWMLAGANNYLGTTTIEDGTLAIAAGGSIGSSSAATAGITISGSGILRIDGGSIVTNFINRPAESAIDFRAGSVTTVGPTSSGTGPGPAVLDIGTSGGGVLNIAGGAMTALNININGADDALNVISGGLVTNNLDNSHGGLLAVGVGGTIRLNNPTGKITTGDGIISGSITGSGGLTKVGSGTLQISGGLSYTGPTNLTGGTVHLTSTGRLPGASSLAVNAGTMLVLDGGASIGALNGSGQVILNNGDLVLASGGTFSGTIQGSGNVVVRGGVLALSGNNTYSGSTNVLSGAVSIKSIGNIGQGAINLGSDSQTGQLGYSGPALSTDRTINLQGQGGGGTITNGGTGPLVLSGLISAAPGDKTLALEAASTSGENMISGGINDPAGSGVLNLAKWGLGKWVLTGNNSYSGSTNVYLGQLIIRGPLGKINSSSIFIANNSTLTLDGGTISSSRITADGVFQFRSGTLNLGNLNSAFGTGNLVIGSDGPCALNVTGGTNSFGTVVIAGPDDSLTLTGGTNFFTSIDNSHGGTFNFLGGSLSIGQDLVIASGTIDGSFGGTGGVTKIGDGTATLTSSQLSYLGPTLVRQGRLIIGSSALLPNATLVSLDAGAVLEYTAGTDDTIAGLSGLGTVINNRVLTIAGNTTPAGGSVGTFSGTMSGSGSLVKSGTGAWTLGGNVGVASLTVNAGTLNLSGTVTSSGITQINTGSTLAIGGSLSGISTLAVNGGTASIAGSVVENGNTLISSNGTVAVSGSLTGATIINVATGTLTVSGGQVVVANALTSKSSGSILNLTGGSITARQIDVASGGEGSSYLSTFNWTAGTIHLTGSNGVNITRVTSGSESSTLLASPDRPFKNVLTLDASKALIVDQTTTIGAGGTLTIAGGALTTRALSVNSAGALNFFAGTLHLTQGTIFDAGFLSQTHLDLLGSGRNLVIDGAATINAPMNLSGGNMIVNSLVNPQNLNFQGGTISIRQGNLEVRAANFLSLSRGTVANVGGALNIAAGGEIDAIGATLNITGASSNAGQINAINSTLNLGGGIAGAGQLNLINSTVHTGAGPLAGEAVAAAGINVLQGKMSSGNLTVASGSLALAPASGTSEVDALSVAGGAQLNLNDNSVVIRSGDLAGVTDQIRAGLSGSGGIVGAASDANLRLGAIVNGTSGSPIYGVFENVTGLSGGEVLLRSTIIGDLNLDGTVTIGDVLDLASNLNKSSATWQMGDVNYDGVVSISDYLDVAAHLGQTLGGNVGAVVENVSTNAVPEPGILILMMSSIMLFGRRRRAESRLRKSC